MSFQTFQHGGPPEERSLFIEIQQTGHGGSRSKKKTKTPAQNLNLSAEVKPISKNRTLLDTFTVGNQEMAISIFQEFDLNVHKNILKLETKVRGRLLQALCTVVRDGNHRALKAYCSETMTNPTTGLLLRPGATSFKYGEKIVDNHDVLYYLEHVKNHYRGVDGPTNTAYFQDTTLDNLKDFVQRVPDQFKSEPLITGLQKQFEFHREFGMITSANYDKVMNRLVVICPTETLGEFSFTTFRNKVETTTHGTDTKIVEVLEHIQSQILEHQRDLGGLLSHWPYVNINLDLECRLHRPGVSSLDAVDTSVSKLMIGKSGVAMAILQLPTIVSRGFARQDPRFSLPLGVKMYLLKNEGKIAIFGTAVNGDKKKLDELFEVAEKRANTKLDKLVDSDIFFIDTGVITCEAQYLYGSMKVGLKPRQLSATGKSPVKGSASIIEELSTSTNPYRTTGMERFTAETKRNLLPSVWQYLADDCLCGTQCFDLLMSARYIADMGFQCNETEIIMIANILMNMYQGVGIDTRRPSLFDKVSPNCWNSLRNVSMIDSRVAGIQYRARVFENTRYSLATHTIRQMLDKYYKHVYDVSAALLLLDKQTETPEVSTHVEVVTDFLEDHDILELEVNPEDEFEIDTPYSDFRYNNQSLTGLNMKYTVSNERVETVTSEKRKHVEVQDYPEQRFIWNVEEAFKKPDPASTDNNSLVDEVCKVWVEESKEDPQYPTYDLDADPLLELTQVVDSYRIRSRKEIEEAIVTRANGTIAVAKLFASFPTYEIDDLVDNHSHGDEEARSVTDPIKFCRYMRKKDAFGYQGATHLCSWWVELVKTEKVSSETFRIINDYLTNNFSHSTFVSLRKMNKIYIATQIGLYHVPHWYIDKYGFVKTKNPSSARHKKIRHYFRAHAHNPTDKLRVQVSLGLVDQGAMYLFRQKKFEEEKVLEIKAVVNSNLNHAYGSTFDQAKLYAYLCDVKHHLIDLGCDTTGPDDEEFRGLTEASIKKHFIRSDGYYHRDSLTLPKQRNLSKYEKDQHLGACDSYLTDARKRDRSKSRERSKTEHRNSCKKLRQ